MAEIPVLRFPISGQEHGSFLLEVSSNGSRPLDLKLIGSESTAVFVVKLRHKKIDEYKAAPGHCTSEEWEQILTSIFIDLKIVPDIEVRADVQSDGTSVTLSFRKNIQGITQRIGSVKLEENDKTEISPFDWCVSAITSRTKVAGELAAAATRIESLEHSIEELKAQLDDFITTKEEDETQMLEKLRDLLNEKKLKIRQQQRLLAAANVDPKKLAKMGGGDGSDVHRNAGSSRSAAEVRRKGAPPQGLPTKPKASASKPTARPSRTTRAATRKETAPESDSEDADDAPPPPRSLPFMKSKKAASPPKPADDDDETPSDDESEL